MTRTSRTYSLFKTPNLKQSKSALISTPITLKSCGFFQPILAELSLFNHYSTPATGHHHLAFYVWISVQFCLKISQFNIKFTRPLFIVLSKMRLFLHIVINLNLECGFNNLVNQDCVLWLPCVCTVHTTIQSLRCMAKGIQNKLLSIFAFNSTLLCW